MRAIENWRLVLQHAWSVRFLVLSAVLSGGSVVLPLMVAAVPPSLLVVYGVVTFLVIVASLLSRFVKQDKLGGDPDGNP